MASRVKEDEKNERIIRNLLKLPDNRRCINCNSLGPQYVCTNFWTFICTNCSGIHREFTHRVKSISIAKFNSQEVSALQGGGNASAKEIYLKEWDPQRNSLPDGSNVERLRTFIKHVYVDRRYTGERSFEKPPRGKMGETEDINESRRLDTYQGGSRSPPYEDTYERRYSDRTSPGGRSPAYDQESRQQSDYKKSPARTEIINDWRREDRFGNGRKSEDSRVSDGGFKPEGRSPDRQKDPDMSSPPVVRPMRDILGENITPLRVIEPPKANSGRSFDGSIHAQRTASSSSLASSNGNPAEPKAEASLIDFDAVPEPSATAPAPQIQQPVPGVSVAQQTTSSVADNWANFDPVSEVKVSQASSNANPLESVLSELSVPASTPATRGLSGSGGASLATAVDNAAAFPSGSLAGASLVSALSSVPTTTLVGNSVAVPSGGAPGAATLSPTQLLSVGGGNSFLNSANAGQWTNSQPQQSSNYVGTGGLTNPQPFTTAVGGGPSNQPWNVPVNPNSQTVPPAPVTQASSQAITPLPPETNPGAGGRKALPEDLFTTSYPGWHTGPPHGMGFHMPYNMQMPMPAFPQPSKSTNPFDVGNEQPPVQPPMFPSMASLQGALPNIAAPTGLLRTSSLGTPSSTWIAPQPSHPSAVPAQTPPYSSAVVPGSYFGQQGSSNMPLRPQGTAGFGVEGSAFRSLNPTQQLGGFYSAPTSQNTFPSVGGNPFG